MENDIYSGMGSSPLKSPDEVGRAQFVERFQPTQHEEMKTVAKETSTSDAFSYLENELEVLHNTVELLYDALRNILREPIPCGDNSVDPRPGISDIQRALWDQGEKVCNERRALQLLIHRIDV